LISELVKLPYSNNALNQGSVSYRPLDLIVRRYSHADGKNIANRIRKKNRTPTTTQNMVQPVNLPFLS